MMKKINHSLSQPNDQLPPLLVLGYLKAHHITQDEVAEILGVNRTTVNRKLNNNGTFTVKEAQILNRKLRIPLQLFFSD
ncbi:helix-turn-helix transcriptional regulator [Furfurilactobacillus milii]|uniref:Helix-turn-helix domain-containing protein n=1 Tax=Furfurilactobacillus milii TaxID=2888272 RepID=A0ABT6D9B3_9LACO|nr:helix-turn-helix transcriptional regulator [Furfurilactobacillus milii]QLE66089.1 hypothetical protein LROSL2_0737 [Furfurilactobacillus rossiae]MCF6160812.1 helix-turn-helix domain-containing protein [Furfurilactobacillus milii]MCF6162994.1 helix-turn-helix domain-containing protein [Furfurilactobacillus milii]MDF9913718.1 helix-turn-helix domain-containing protein [Furfurilactobacillus milii]QLE68519.1 hypothetical protein LROSL3_0738 [Furfurilactobacillus rossiae]